MARKTIRINIPINSPADFSVLLNAIVTYDKSLGSASVLQTDPSIDMKTFATNLATADGLRAQSEAARKLSIDLMEQAQTMYGMATGQSVNTVGTLYFTEDLIKQSLLKTYKGNEEALGNYGYDIVIGQAKSPVRKTPGSKK